MTASITMPPSVHQRIVAIKGVNIQFRSVEKDRRNGSRVAPVRWVCAKPLVMADDAAISFRHLERPVGGGGRLGHHGGHVD
jgi:hypothetical protein